MLVMLCALWVSGAVFLHACILRMHMEVRGQLTGVGSRLPPCGPWGLNSGPWSWQQVLLPPTLSR